MIRANNMSEELVSISLTVMSASFNTLFKNLALGFKYLSSFYSASVQNTVYSAILAAYSGRNAWKRDIIKKKILVITTLVKEILRY